MSLIKKLKNFITQEISWTWILLIFLADLLFSIVILKKVPCKFFIILFLSLSFCLILFFFFLFINIDTEIDWIAYMEEVEGYLSGERDYLKIRGCTGPLVYPAGFLYIFSYLYYLTDSGKNIFYGQIIFTILYLLQLLFILYLYYITSSLKNYHFNIINKIDKKKNNKEEEDEDIEIKKNINYDFKSPIYLCFILILSKRLHSIYILRLFNDTFAIFFGYLSIILFSFSYYTIGSLIFSFAVSIKMNLLLFSPGILLLYLLYKGNKNNYYSFPIIQIILCGILQIIIGLPFLLTYPISYILKAFELTRVFDYKWTVNYKFLTENLFYNKKLSILLLLLTVISKFINLYIYLLSLVFFFYYLSLSSLFFLTIFYFSLLTFLL